MSCFVTHSLLGFLQDQWRESRLYSYTCGSQERPTCCHHKQCLCRFTMELSRLMDLGISDSLVFWPVLVTES